MSALKQALVQQIRQTGPLSVAQFMAACLYDPRRGYYAREPAIAADGDFITAPESSQMFGELIGLWCVHEWDALGRPQPFQLIELGPGNGALISDAWRAARIQPAFRDAAQIHLIEASDALRGRQAQALARFDAKPRWHERFETVPEAAGFVVANEFFDCLPIRQFVRSEDGWRERLVGLIEDDLSFGLFARAAHDPIIPPALHDAPLGTIAEIAPGLEAWIDLLARRLKAAPGRVLIIDYAGDGSGDTLQAVRGHAKESPLEAPGEADLTARVDFRALKILARASGLDVHGPVDQGIFLAALGIAQRAQALADAHPERTERIARELLRLTDDSEMGVLFKAICLSSPDLPAPAAF
ncbi:MAG TPA: SAM-dependent methyltransferase [Caulobacterales bacterium]|nr:SAM-dependent methyltransferase [Caulobacterales bacterium]